MVTTPSATMGERLRAARHAKGLTQMQLAVAAETSVGIVSELERDTYLSPGLDLLRRLTRALDVPLESVLGPNGAAFEASRSKGAA